jgi:hypothetical protein
MSDWPSVRLPPPNLMGYWAVSAMGAKASGQGDIPGPVGASSSTLSPVNQAYIFPFRLYTIAKPLSVVWYNGAASVGNIDVGIYDSERHRLCSTGAVAQGTINVLQAANLTTTPELLPGDYFMAMSGSASTGTMFRNTSTDEFSMPGNMKYLMTSAHPLPATITLTKDTTTSPQWWLFAINWDGFAIV